MNEWIPFFLVKKRLKIALTETWPLIMTSSENRTLTGLDFNLAFFAALINADLGDWKKRHEKRKRSFDWYLTLNLFYIKANKNT